MKDAYVQEFERYLVGTADQKSEWRAELIAHLEEARLAGDLEGAIARLGSPRNAAVAFGSGRTITPSSWTRRLGAQVIDHLPLLIVSAITARVSGYELFVGFPPLLAISSTYPIIRNLAIPLALVWSWLGLAILEGRLGRTPGKVLLSLRTVSADGTTMTVGQAIKRRFSILVGLLAWADWVAAFFTPRRQRLLDLLARTVVISDPTRKSWTHAETGLSDPESRA